MLHGHVHHERDMFYTNMYTWKRIEPTSENKDKVTNIMRESKHVRFGHFTGKYEIRKATKIPIDNTVINEHSFCRPNT